MTASAVPPPFCRHNLPGALWPQLKSRGSSLGGGQALGGPKPHRDQSHLKKSSTLALGCWCLRGALRLCGGAGPAPFQGYHWGRKASASVTVRTPHQRHPHQRLRVARSARQPAPNLFRVPPAARAGKRTAGAHVNKKFSEGGGSTLMDPRSESGMMRAIVPPDPSQATLQLRCFPLLAFCAFSFPLQPLVDSSDSQRLGQSESVGHG